MPGMLVVTPPGPDADVLMSSLRNRGLEVHGAPNGAAAVDVAMRRSPEVILMDPALSAMDRWHAVKRLNTSQQTARIPVLTLGSDASTPAGLQRALAKVERTLGHLPVPRQTPTPGQQAPRRQAAPPAAPTSKGAAARARRPRSTGADGAPPTPAWTPPRQFAPRTPRILVVDDNALNRDMLSRRLVRRGYDVEVAADGQTALELVRLDAFDLVILDWMMPGLSGIDVLRRLRADWSTIELPVIMATAKTDADDVVEALRNEANDYVTKPLNFDVVLARIKSQLGLVRAHRELAHSERRFRALLENTGDMIVQYHLDGHVLYVSPASHTLLGVTPEALRTRSFYDWLHPIDRRELEAQQQSRPVLPPAFTFIARMQRQDQSWIWVETSARQLRENDEVVVQAACRDVTEHMEGLSGGEPPLPLGGDIMAHPGWRGGATRGDVSEVPPVPAVQVAVVVHTVEGSVQADPGSVATEVARQVRIALEQTDG